MRASCTCLSCIMVRVNRLTNCSSYWLTLTPAISVRHFRVTFRNIGTFRNCGIGRNTNDKLSGTQDMWKSINVGAPARTQSLKAEGPWEQPALPINLPLFLTHWQAEPMTVRLCERSERFTQSNNYNFIVCLFSCYIRNPSCLVTLYTSVLMSLVSNM